MTQCPYQCTRIGISFSNREAHMEANRSESMSSVNGLNRFCARLDALQHHRVSVKGDQSDKLPYRASNLNLRQVRAFNTCELGNIAQWIPNRMIQGAMSMHRMAVKMRNSDCGLTQQLRHHAKTHHFFSLFLMAGVNAKMQMTMLCRWQTLQQWMHSRWHALHDHMHLQPSTYLSSTAIDNACTPGSVRQKPKNWSRKGLILPQEVPDRWMTIKAHGTAVGLPSDDDMGNSGASPFHQL